MLFMDDNTRMRARWLRTRSVSKKTIVIMSIVVGVFLADAFTKSAAQQYLPPAGAIYISPFLNLKLAYNQGISFGLLKANSTTDVITLLVFQCAILAALGYLAMRSSVPIERASLSLIVGGAVGNIFDRAVNHAVTDFLDLHLYGWHWPTFNVADIAISIGAVLLIWTTIRNTHRQGPQA
ncbi:MAG: signal peptidase II [Hyphomicrobium sp.]|nr:MAG: signal peptidase II [Hyphomicrobium sp.]PPC98204.1 MAG: signal peptidase II [Hyphomicrobium sp.]